MALSISIHPWRVIAAINVAFFSLFLVLAAFPLVHIARVAFKRFTRIVILITLLYCTKIASGGLLLYLLDHLSDSNSNKEINIFIASMVLASLAPAFLLMCNFKLVGYINHLERGDNVPKKHVTLFGHIFSLRRNIVTLLRGTSEERLDSTEGIYWTLVIVTIALSSAGNGVSSSNYTAARGLIRAAGILYLIEWIILIGLIVYAIRTVIVMKRVTYQKYVNFLLILAAIAAIFVGVRVCAYIAQAFTLKKGYYGFGQSRFSYLTGEWKLYAFVTFMPECIASGIWVVILWCLSKHLKHERYDTGSESPLVPKADDSDS
ncbi:hypothetical protein BON22_3219 [Cyberlindnera fabianii]|uniref:Uncharacterized protein n=1 Tax=Cyberlindnera fabianii TaxID=36022 RepID=A0A1V2L5E0_CYBFA|nr:hypothetical protein BON22_3219 [Cyberlindnera fabianii]